MKNYNQEFYEAVQDFNERSIRSILSKIEIDEIDFDPFEEICFHPGRENLENPGKILNPKILASFSSNEIISRNRIEQKKLQF